MQLSGIYGNADFILIYAHMISFQEHASFKLFFNFNEPEPTLSITLS
jgi:hypothetical protein